MKSQYAPWTHTGSTSEDIATQVGAGRIKYDVLVPRNTRCVRLEDGGGRSHWVVQDLSFIADKHSMLYHDADHYGIAIPEPMVESIRPVGDLSAQVRPDSPAGAPRVVELDPKLGLQVGLSAQGTARIEDRDGNYLAIYASGSGAMSFVWRDPQHCAAGRAPNSYEAGKAVELMQAEGRLTGWLLDEPHPGHFELMPPVKRVGAELLLAGASGETVYRYAPESERYPNRDRLVFTAVGDRFIGPKPHFNAALQYFVSHELRYPSSLKVDEKMIHRETGREHVVTGFVDGFVAHTDGVNEYVHTPEEVFQTCSVPRIVREVEPLMSVGAKPDPAPQSAQVKSAKTPIPMESISTILNEVMAQASANGANSISMPDEYVAVAHFLSYPGEYELPAGWAPAAKPQDDSSPSP